MSEMNMQRVQDTLVRVGCRNLNSTTEELQEALLYIASGNDQILFDPKAPVLIKLELEKRQKKEETKLAEKSIFWQKRSVKLSCLSIVIAALALIVAILAYYK